jgi:hypothetical protein
VPTAKVHIFGFPQFGVHGSNPDTSAPYRGKVPLGIKLRTIEALIKDVDPF